MAITRVLMIMLVGLVSLGATMALAEQVAQEAAQEVAQPARPDDVPEALWNTLLAIDAKATAVRTLHASFTQERHLLLLKKPVTSQGHVWVKANLVRWDTTEPGSHTLLMTPGQVQVYYPSLKSLEIYNLGDRLADLASSPLPELATMVRLFTVAEAAPESATPMKDALRLRLTPRGKPLSEHLKHVIVQLDPTRGVMTKMHMVDLQGEQTVLTFSELQLNSEIDDTQFTLDLPDDVTVTRPLESNDRSRGDAN